MFDNELERLFGGNQHPGLEALADYWPNEWEGTFERLADKDWRTALEEDFDAQGGIMEGINVLSARGFIYFLPGLMRMTHGESGLAIVSAILTRFTYEEEEQRHAPDVQDVISKLNREQRQFVVRYLRDAQKHEPTLCPVLVDSAVANLMNGTASAYKHSEILRWARESGAL